MDPRPTRSRRKEARPAEVLAAALDCFAVTGFAATRMEDIAARAGVSKGTVYLYYPSKQAIFEALVQNSLVPRIAQIETALAAFPGSATDRLRLFASVLGNTIAEPRLVAIPKLVMAEAGNFPDMARFYRREVVGRGLALVGGILRQGVEAGEFRPLDPAITARLFMAPLMLVAIWQTTFAPVEEQPIPPDQILSQHLSLFLASIRAPGGSP
ncbi:TetR/AcrR family transcriptional regulator [Oleisolibacter albus]|uniref:TetR/AcrR family transcriptional regulator n=1 Tax=Oleisolibacter albus TaxID=2171757 RepID=UPI000DF13DAA|nr:TetR/AcrR family transcriptional regulator [Oleisolibacter albus]